MTFRVPERLRLNEPSECVTVSFWVIPAASVQDVHRFLTFKMDAILQALGGILLRAVPTVVLLILVHLFLKHVFFRPLQNVLDERRQATEGARESAQRSLAMAAEKSAMYDIALKEARTELYREQEETRRAWIEQQSAQLEEARHKTREAIQDASHKLAADVEAAKRDLASTSQMLAMQITEALVGGRKQ